MSSGLGLFALAALSAAIWAYLLLGRGVFWLPRLLATGISLAATFLAPPLLLLAGGDTAWLGASAWLAMTVAYAPILRFYGVSVRWAPLLPAVALVYLAATVDCARRHWLGIDGEWKGRVQWQSQR